MLRLCDFILLGIVYTWRHDFIVKDERVTTATTKTIAKCLKLSGGITWPIPSIVSSIWKLRTANCFDVGFSFSSFPRMQSTRVEISDATRRDRCGSWFIVDDFAADQIENRAQKDIGFLRNVILCLIKREMSTIRQPAAFEALRLPYKLDRRCLLKLSLLEI